jgi:hypothetical protein
MSFHADMSYYYGIRSLSLYTQKHVIGRYTDQLDAVSICTSDISDIYFNIITFTPTSRGQSLAF